MKNNNNKEKKKEEYFLALKEQENCDGFYIEQEIQE